MSSLSKQYRILRSRQRSAGTGDRVPRMRGRERRAADQVATGTTTAGKGLRVTGEGRVELDPRTARVSLPRNADSIASRDYVDVAAAQLQLSSDPFATTTSATVADQLLTFARTTTLDRGQHFRPVDAVTTAVYDQGADEYRKGILLRATHLYEVHFHCRRSSAASVTMELGYTSDHGVKHTVVEHVYSVGRDATLVGFVDTSDHSGPTLLWIRAYGGTSLNLTDSVMLLKIVRAR